MDINAIWDAIAPFVTGTTMGSLVVGIIAVVLKSAFTKTINKLDIEKITEKTVNATVNQIKNVSFSQNIQPIVEEQLKKVIPLFNEYIDKTLKQTQQKYEALLDVITGLSQYFDNAYGIPEEVKNNLKNAIEKAKELTEEEEVVNYSVTLDEQNNVVVEHKEIEVKMENPVIVEQPTSTNVVR